MKRPRRVLICGRWYRILWQAKPRVNGEIVAGYTWAERCIIAIRTEQVCWQDTLLHEIEHAIESDSGVAYAIKWAPDDEDVKEEMRIQITTPHRLMALRSIGWCPR